MDIYHPVMSLQMQPHMDIEWETGEWYPSVYFNDFWLLRDHLVMMNETVAEAPLHLSLSPIGIWKWTLYLQMDQSFNLQVAGQPSTLDTGF